MTASSKVPASGNLYTTAIQKEPLAWTAEDVDAIKAHIRKTVGDLREQRLEHQAALAAEEAKVKRKKATRKKSKTKEPEDDEASGDL